MELDELRRALTEARRRVERRRLSLECRPRGADPAPLERRVAEAVAEVQRLEGALAAAEACER